MDIDQLDIFLLDIDILITGSYLIGHRGSKPVVG